MLFYCVAYFCQGMRPVLYRQGSACKEKSEFLYYLLKSL